MGTHVLGLQLQAYDYDHDCDYTEKENKLMAESQWQWLCIYSTMYFTLCSEHYIKYTMQLYIKHTTYPIV